MGISNVSPGTVAADIANIPNTDKNPDVQYTYTFASWTKNTPGGFVDVNLNEETITSNIIYYARYNKTVNKYKVTFVEENGTTVIKVDPNDEYNYRQYNYGSGGADIVVPTAPDKSGYHFDGWLKKV
jgi:hypothetical protein